MVCDYFLCIFVRGSIDLVPVDLAGKVMVLEQLNDSLSGADTQFYDFLVFQQFITMAEKKIPDALRVELGFLAILEDRLAASVGSACRRGFTVRSVHFPPRTPGFGDHVAFT